MHWLILAALAALTYALYYLFLKVSAEHIHQVLGALILQAVATATGLGLFAALRLAGKPLTGTGFGIGMAALAGVAVGVAEILTFYVFEQGVATGRGMPVIVGGSVALAAVLGVLFLGETPTPRTVSGVVLVAAGVVLLAGR